MVKVLAGAKGIESRSLTPSIAAVMLLEFRFSVYEFY